MKPILARARWSFAVALLTPLLGVLAADTITTVAGNGTVGFSGDGGAATASSLNAPAGVAVDGAGNVFIADRLNHRVRRVDGAGNITTFAGNGIAGFSGDGGPAAAAGLNSPTGVAVDGAGNVYIAEQASHRIRKVDAAGNISTFAGNGTAGFAGDGGPAASTSLNAPSSVAVDGGGNLFISDTQNHRVRRVDAAAGTIATVAGNGTPGFSGDGAAAITASLNAPAGLVLDQSGNLLIADSANRRVRKVGGGAIISTLAGNGTAGFAGDGGPATAASLSLPAGVAVDGGGNVSISDQADHRIRRVDAAGIIGTLAGNGAAGFSGDGGPALSASLNTPLGVALDAGGNVLVADEQNNRIRRIAVASAPPPASGISADLNPVKINTPVTFSASLPGATTFTWDFGDASGLVAGNPVQHSYATEGSFVVMAVPDTGTTATLIVTTLAPNLGAEGVPNPAVGTPPVVNPLNGVSIAVAASDGGVVELAVDVSALNRSRITVDAETDFPARTVVGRRPTEKFTEPGLYVATTRAVDSATRQVVAKGRRTLALSARETGKSGALQASDKGAGISLRSMKGKFRFDKDTPDSVTFMGDVFLPAGLDLSAASQPFSAALGNVVGDTSFDTKGRAPAAARVKKAKIKYPKLAKGVTTTLGGEAATVQVTLSLPDMDAAGFDTEGIAPALLPAEVGLKAVPRSVQVQMLLAGVAYETQVPVQYKLNTKRTSGSLGARGIIPR